MFILSNSAIVAGLGTFDSVSMTSDTATGIVIPRKCFSEGSSGSPSSFSPGSVGSGIAFSAPPGFEARRYHRRRSSLPSHTSEDPLAVSLPTCYVWFGWSFPDYISIPLEYI